MHRVNAYVHSYLALFAAAAALSLSCVLALSLRTCNAHVCVCECVCTCICVGCSRMCEKEVLRYHLRLFVFYTSTHNFTSTSAASFALAVVIIFTLLLPSEIAPHARSFVALRRVVLCVFYHLLRVPSSPSHSSCPSPSSYVLWSAVSAAAAASPSFSLAVALARTSSLSLDPSISVTLPSLFSFPSSYRGSSRCCCICHLCICLVPFRHIFVCISSIRQTIHNAIRTLSLTLFCVCVCA